MDEIFNKRIFRTAFAIKMPPERMLFFKKLVHDEVNRDDLEENQEHLRLFVEEGLIDRSGKWPELTDYGREIADFFNIEIRKANLLRRLLR